MALFWRIFGAISLVNLLVLIVFVVLATLHFDGIHSRLIGERLVVLAERAAEPFEATAGLGLPISSMRNAAGILERIRQTDDDISAIHVFDGIGSIVHSTAGDAPRRIPSEAAAALLSAQGRSWHGEAEGSLLGGVGISRDGGESAGGVLIVYPSTQNATRVWAMASEITLAAIAILLVAALLCAPLLRAGIRRDLDAFEAFDTAIETFERDAWRSAASQEADGASTPGDGLRQLLDDAERRYRDIGRALPGRGRS